MLCILQCAATSLMISQWSFGNACEISAVGTVGLIARREGQIGSMFPNFNVGVKGLVGNGCEKKIRNISTGVVSSRRRKDEGLGPTLLTDAFDFVDGCGVQKPLLAVALAQETRPLTFTVCSVTQSPKSKFCQPLQLLQLDFPSLGDHDPIIHGCPPPSCIPFPSFGGADPRQSLSHHFHFLSDLVAFLGWEWQTRKSTPL
ncbi:hypothetical protein QBC44DRAFT_333290 [Cladorrhinum sp. PSN332]|nr:hypothetical protein QBC44DRAFT_333290 [Cladorrhinum sp. PSN332]